MKIQFLASLIVLLCCCQYNSEKGPIPQNAPKLERTIEEKQSQYIENGELTSQWESDLAGLVKSRHFIVENEPVTNRHVDNLVDTVRHYRQNGIYMQSYKTASQEWIFDAQILDSGVELTQRIKVGVHKEALEDVLGTQLTSDSIKVGNFEGTSLFIFKFRNDTLTKFVYEGYVD